MNVYHGSYTAIEEVDLSFAEPGKDFGRGFYVANLPEQAQILRASAAKNVAMMAL